MKTARSEKQTYTIKQFPASRNQLAVTVVACVMWFGGAVPANALTINLNPNAGLSGNTAALNAFRRAASQWESRLYDPVVVNIDAGLSSSGFTSPNVIGSASSVVLSGNYNSIRSSMISDAGFELDDSIVSY